MLLSGWTIAAAQSTPNLDSEITQEMDRVDLVLRNVYAKPAQAYAVGFPSAGDLAELNFMLYDALLNSQAGTIEPGEERSLRLYSRYTPRGRGRLTIHIAVVYADGAVAGDSTVLRKLLATRSIVRGEIPFARRAFQDLSASAPTLPSLIQDVKNWTRM